MVFAKSIGGFRQPDDAKNTRSYSEQKLDPS